MREMKDSGIEWIGEIPENWNIQRGKFIFKKLSRPVKDSDEVITCFRDGEVTLRKNRREEGFTLADKEFGYQGIEPGDLVVHGMDGFAGSIGISDSRGKATPVLNVMGSSENKKYYMYYLRSMAYGDVFKATATGIRVRSCNINWNKLAELRYPVPDKNTQKSIADFLDSKCVEIDGLSEDIEKQIDTLKEYKKSVITQAVTKGLNPNVEMKESGLEWIGEIPACWTTKKIKFLVSVIRGGSPRPINQYLSDSDDGYNWIRIGDTTKGNKYITETKLKIVKNGISSTRLVSKNTLLLTNSMSYGEPYILKLNGCIHDGWLAFFDYKNIDMMFLYYSLLSENTRNQFSIAVNGSVVVNLNIEKVKNTYLVVPPINEQKSIVDFLDSKCIDIDIAIEGKQKQLEVLKEYKKSLIYIYVTGKKAVPENE